MVKYRVSDSNFCFLLATLLRCLINGAFNKILLDLGPYSSHDNEVFARVICHLTLKVNRVEKVASSAYNQHATLRPFLFITQGLAPTSLYVQCKNYVMLKYLKWILY